MIGIACHAGKAINLMVVTIYMGLPFSDNNRHRSMGATNIYDTIDAFNDHRKEIKFTFVQSAEQKNRTID